MSRQGRSAQGLNSLHDRIAQIHDILKDLRAKIPQIDGREPSADDTAGIFLPNSTQSPSSTAQGPPLAAVDPEAEEQLCSDISDSLRDLRNDYDTIVEDAVDMGWLLAEDKPRQNVDAHDHDNDNDYDYDDHHEYTPVAALSETGLSAEQVVTERVRFRKALQRTDKAITATRRVFRATRASGLLRKQEALRAKVFQELETYVADDDSDYDDSDATDYEDEAPGTLPRLSAPRHAPAPAPKKPKQSAQAIAAAAHTNALRQLQQTVAGEASRSDFANEMLAESARALGEIDAHYRGGSGAGSDINSSLKKARGLTRSLLLNQKSDTWYLQYSMYVLVATIGWLVFRRLMYGPLWLLVWWPLRTSLGTAWWVGKTGASVVGAVGGSGSESSMLSGAGVSVPAAQVSYSTGSASSVMATTSVGAHVHATEAASASSSMVDEVSRIIVEAVTAGTEVAHEPQASETGETGETGEASEAPNRKKRMWEEPVEEAKHEEQQRKEQAEREAQAAEAKAEAHEEQGKEPEAHQKDEL